MLNNEVDDMDLYESEDIDNFNNPTDHNLSYFDLNKSQSQSDLFEDSVLENHRLASANDLFFNSEHQIKFQIKLNTHPISQKSQLTSLIAPIFAQSHVAVNYFGSDRKITFRHNEIEAYLKTFKPYHQLDDGNLLLPFFLQAYFQKYLLFEPDSINFLSFDIFDRSSPDQLNPIKITSHSIASILSTPVLLILRKNIISPFHKSAIPSYFKHIKQFEEKKQIERKQNEERKQKYFEEKEGKEGREVRKNLEEKEGEERKDFETIEIIGTNQRKLVESLERYKTGADLIEKAYAIQQTAKVLVVHYSTLKIIETKKKINDFNDKIFEIYKIKQNHFEDKLFIDKATFQANISNQIEIQFLEPVPGLLEVTVNEHLFKGKLNLKLEETKILQIYSGGFMGYFRGQHLIERSLHTLIGMQANGCRLNLQFKCLDANKVVQYEFIERVSLNKTLKHLMRMGRKHHKNLKVIGDDSLHQ